MGQIIHEFSRQQRLQQANEGDTQRAGPDNAQRVQIERYPQSGKSGQSTAHSAFITDGGQQLAAGDGKQGQQDDGDQRRRDGFDIAWRPQHNQQRQHEQAEDQRPCAPEMWQLGKKDQYPQRIHKSGHHRLRNKSHQSGHTAQPKQNLNNTSQNDSGQDIADAVLMHHRANHQRHRPRRSGDHGRSAAKNRHRQAEHNGRNQADFRVNPSNHGEGDNLWNQGQRGEYASQRFAGQ